MSKIPYSVSLRMVNLQELSQAKADGKLSEFVPKYKAFAQAQYDDVITLEQLAKHISGHGCNYDDGDIVAVLNKTMSCTREQMLNGQKVQMGELGSFYLQLVCEGAESVAKFNPDNNIKKVKVVWEPGPKFLNLIHEAEFEKVSTREVQNLVRKMERGNQLNDEEMTKVKTAFPALFDSPSDDNSQSPSGGTPSGDNGQQTTDNSQSPSGNNGQQSGGDPGDNGLV